MIPNWSTFLINKIDIRKQKMLLRKRNIVNKNDSYACRLIFNQQEYVNFSSNDYLGLSQNKAIIKAWQNGLSKYGAGSGSSSHIIGYSNAHAKLEEQLANWLGYPKAILFISGYTANQSVITTLMSKNDYILADRLSHASLLESAMLSPAKLRRFAHNQPNALKRLSAPINATNNNSHKNLVITEGVFSMDGDYAPLAQLQVIAHQTKAWLLVDDAHGIGIRGDEGRGSCYLNNVKPELLVVTFGKALGLSGAALLCDELTAEYFLQYARHLIYSTSMPPSQAVALSEAIVQIRHADELRTSLNRNIDYFLKLVKHYKLPFLNSTSAIQPLIVGCNQRCLQLSKFLADRGFWVPAIRQPTVAVGKARLRITLLANHSFTDLLKLVETLNEFWKKNKYKNEQTGNC